jgi:choline dehydrogenase-like flavoprotein
MRIPQVKGIRDIVAEGVAGGWNVIDGSKLENNLTLEADVVVIGTGAGGGTAAEILSEAGLKVVMIEEGPLKTSNDFNMQESTAYSNLYQEGLSRGCKDNAITVLQGRCVGGSTTVNWTSSFRTPEATLNYWRDNFNVADISKEHMAPWFEQMEKRLNISKWAVPPNENNDLRRCRPTSLHRT